MLIKVSWTINSRYKMRFCLMLSAFAPGVTKGNKNTRNTPATLNVPKTSFEGFKSKASNTSRRVDDSPAPDESSLMVQKTDKVLYLLKIFF